MSSAQFVRCIEGHVYDSERHSQCPRCLKSESDNPSKDETLGSPSNTMPHAAIVTNTHKVRLAYSIGSAAVLVALACTLTALWSPWRSSLLNKTDSSSATPSAKREVAKGHSEPADKGRDSVSSDPTTNSGSSPEAPSGKVEPIAKLDPGPTSEDRAHLTRLGEDKAQIGQTHKERPTDAIQSTMESGRFTNIFKACEELRRVRLMPIPEGFKGWASKAPALPLPPSVSRSHSPEVYAELQKSHFALAMHWFLQGAANVDAQVRVACWENAAALGHPYAMWALSGHYSKLDPVRQQAWAELALERGVPHARNSAEHSARRSDEVDKTMLILAASRDASQNSMPYKSLVRLIPKTCDLRIAVALYETDVIAWAVRTLNENKALLSDPTVLKDRDRLHEMLLEEFELRGALRPHCDTSDLLDNSEFLPREEGYPEGVAGLLVLLHRVATQANSPLIVEPLYQRHHEKLPKKIASAYRNTLKDIEPALLSGLASRVIDDLDPFNSSMTKVSLRKAVPPTDKWAVEQISSTMKRLIDTVDISTEAFSFMQYVAGRAAENNKRYDEASAFYEASYLHDMYLAAFDYSQMLFRLSQSSQDRDALREAADSWAKAAILLQLRPELVEGNRRLGLQKENVKGESSQEMIARLINHRPSNLDPTGIAKRKKEIETLIHQAKEQDSTALLLLGSRTLPDPELLINDLESLFLLIESSRRGNAQAMLATGRHAMRFESRLGLPNGDKCIFSFVGWLLSEDPNDSNANDLQLAQSFRRIPLRGQLALKTWMDEMATAFGKSLPAELDSPRK